MLWLLSAVGPLSSAAGAATSFDTALARATANVATPPGEKYDVDFGKQFGERYVDTVARCVSGAEDADRGKFTLLFRVAPDGTIEKVLAKPTTKIAKCLVPEARKGIFVKPLRGSYWVRIGFSITE
jgi:hypothetical protein